MGSKVPPKSPILSLGSPDLSIAIDDERGGKVLHPLRVNQEIKSLFGPESEGDEEAAAQLYHRTACTPHDLLMQLPLIHGHLP